MKKPSLLVVTLTIVLTQFLSVSSAQPQTVSANDSLKVMEKVYLHVDRDCYFAGEDIWFNAYLIDALDRLLTDHSKNLHVELISPSLKIISNRVIHLEGGLGNGDFKLPDNIKSGRYILRAYTNYMRNYGDKLFFNKDIAIINPADSNRISENVKYVADRIKVSFFPEGGSLIDNVSSIVAFKATDYLEKGCDVSGKIFSSEGKLITTFKSTHLGMGMFFLRPLNGLSYYAVVRGADSIDIRTELPKSLSTGVTFSTSINQSKELTVTTKTNPETLAILSEQDLLLTFSVRKKAIKIVAIKIKNPVTGFVIPTDDLPDGIIMITLSTMKDLPLSERLIYIERESPLKLQIETDKHSYNKREPVTLKISLPENSFTRRNGSVSLAVVNESFTNNQSKFPRTISSYFLLESDVRGFVEDPSYYFDPANPERLRDLDLLLHTQGWRDFAWKYDLTYFSPENGFTVSGRLRKENKNEPIEDTRVSIGLFGNNSALMKTIPVDSTGRFKLIGLELVGQARLIATGIGKKDRPEGMLTLDSINYSPAKVTDSLLMVSVIPENDQDQAKLKSYYKINESIRKKYKLSDTVSIGEVYIMAKRQKDPQELKVEISRLKYINPEGEVKVTDQMLHYQCAIEVLRDRISGLVVTGGYPNYSIYIRGTSTLTGNTLPLVLVDGHESSFDELIYMPVNFIDRIDVLKSGGACAIFGLRGSTGVINIITKAGGGVFEHTPVTSSVNKRFSGYDAPRIFYSPAHLTNSTSEYIPDLRSTLYWKPDLTLDGSNKVILNYYNGDNSSIIRIIAEGITSTGIPVTGQAEYEVR